VLHHNHPSGRGVPLPDLETLQNPGEWMVIAHGHNGELSMASFTPQARRFLDENHNALDEGERRVYPRGYFGEFLRNAQAALAVPFRKAIEAGWLDRDTAGLALSGMLPAPFTPLGIDYVGSHEPVIIQRICGDNSFMPRFLKNTFGEINLMKSSETLFTDLIEPPLQFAPTSIWRRYLADLRKMPQSRSVRSEIERAQQELARCQNSPDDLPPAA
jgi:hypothetical protein